MLPLSEFYACLHTIWTCTQYVFIVLMLISAVATLLDLCAYLIYSCVAMCAYCMTSREDIAGMEAESHGMWRAIRRGRRGGRSIADEEGAVREGESRELVCEQIEADMRFAGLEKMDYGTLSL